MTEAEENTRVFAEGDVAPDFELLADDGEPIKLSDYKGKTVALYFYPMDDTPGCTTEAVGIRDAWGEFIKRDVIVLGVSSDGIDSHREFKSCYELPFKLLSDPMHVGCDRYGTWGIDGRAMRTTFLISPSGRVIKTWRLVDPTKHAKWLLAEVNKQLVTA